jgi:hypothetical protein
MKNTKDLAVEIVNKYLQVGKETIYTDGGAYVKTMPFYNAQICAIIHVEGIIDFLDTNLQDFVSADLKQYYENVIKDIESL